MHVFPNFRGFECFIMKKSDLSHKFHCFDFEYNFGNFKIYQGVLKGNSEIPMIPPNDPKTH